MPGMCVCFVRPEVMPTVKKGDDIEVGTLFSALKNGKRHLFYRTHVAIACLTDANLSCEGNAQFVNFREHKDHELIVRD